MTQGRGRLGSPSHGEHLSVGTGTNYANTAKGLISAINDSGLGLNATFGTAARRVRAVSGSDGAAATGTAPPIPAS